MRTTIAADVYESFATCLVQRNQASDFIAWKCLIARHVHRLGPRELDILQMV
jgi:hypothetical protein